MKASSWSWVMVLASAGAAAVAIAHGHREAAHQALALAAARQENLQLLRLKEDNRQLEAGRLSAEERSRLEGSKAGAEAARLRLGELQRRIADAEASPDSIPDQVAVPMESWTYAGRASPRAALRSVLWAASRGDVERLADLLGFSPGVRAQADALFDQLPAASQQEFGSPERVVATLLAGSFPKDASALTLLSGSQFGEGAAVLLRVDHADGRSRTNGFQLQRAPGGWQLMVPASVMASYARALTEGQPSPEGSDP
ncbi:MAG TPA: hypothetical protein VN775_00345 [Opitutaceae bacterium]|nr:hypothetical protein [Opitutaceae bacterium]